MVEVATDRDALCQVSKLFYAHAMAPMSRADWTDTATLAYLPSAQLLQSSSVIVEAAAELHVIDNSEVQRLVGRGANTETEESGLKVTELFDKCVSLSFNRVLE